MIKNFLILLVLSVVVCFVNGWRVFPLPDAPAQPANLVKPTSVLPRYPITTTKGIYSPNNLVKPTSVLSQLPVVSTTGNYYPNKSNVPPKNDRPVLSSQNVAVPSNELLPPKVLYFCYYNQVFSLLYFFIYSWWKGTSY